MGKKMKHITVSLTIKCKKNVCGECHFNKRFNFKNNSDCGLFQKQMTKTAGGQSIRLAECISAEMPQVRLGGFK